MTAFVRQKPKNAVLGMSSPRDSIAVRSAAHPARFIEAEQQLVRSFLGPQFTLTAAAWR